MKIRLDAIVFDAGTQIRASINESVVADYAERMTEGAKFPPVVLFHDGNAYYMADGFHRGLASQRNKFVDIEADVKPGTKTDALWFALGANVKNAHRMTSTDLKHAIVLAFKTWPDRSANQVAAQVGCTHAYVDGIRKQVASSDNLPEVVVGKDGKRYPSRQSTAPAPRRKCYPDRTKAAREHRGVRVRELAGNGHTVLQIAATLNISEQHCRQIIKTDGIDVPATRAMGKSRRINATRIIEHIVSDAENLTADVGLIDFTTLNQPRLGAWILTLTAAKQSLVAFIRRLEKEHRKYEAA